MPTLNDCIVGKCSLCGGLVTVPKTFMSTVPPVPTCESCGAVEDVASRLPVVPMKPRNPGAENWESRKKFSPRSGRFATADGLRVVEAIEYVWSG